MKKLILMLSLVITTHIMATRVIVRSTNMNSVERDINVAIETEVGESEVVRDIDIKVSQKNLYITCITIDELEEMLNKSIRDTFVESYRTTVEEELKNV